MIIKDGTLTKTSATVIIEDKNEEKYNYSSWFRIDKKENEGWKEVNVIDEKYAFTDIAYLPDENGKVEMNTNWKNLYGKLEKGEYRLVKEVYDNGNNYIYVEFTIEQMIITYNASRNIYQHFFQKKRVFIKFYMKSNKIML